MPLQLTPVTDDVDEARQWYDVLPSALGVEGLVVKGAGTRYIGGSRTWLKVNSAGVRLLGLCVLPVMCLVSMLRGRFVAVSDGCRARLVA